MWKLQEPAFGRLAANPKLKADGYFLVGAGRLERPTYGLEGRCSIRLSYAPTLL